MQIRQFVSGLLNSKMYLLCEGGHAVVFDPFVYEFAQEPRLDFSLLTHEHYDHISGVNYLKEQMQIPVMCSKRCAEFIEDPRKNAARYFDAFVHLQSWTEVNPDAEIDHNYSCHADRVLEDHCVLKWAGHEIQCIVLPGHSPGGMGYLVDEKILFSGDNIIPNSKTELRMPYGNKKEWYSVTKPYLDRLCDDVIVYPGHGSCIRIGEWRKSQGGFDA